MNRNLRRKLSYGSNATLVTLLVVALVVVLYAVADAFRYRVDFSAEGANQLQRDTLNKIRLLDEAGEPVRITAFSAQTGKKESIIKNRELTELLEELRYRSKVIDTRFVDFDRERLTAETLGVTQYATVVVQRGEDRVDLRDRDLFRHKGKKNERTIEFLGEAAMNEAFSRLMADERRVIYSLVGHGELDIGSAEPGGMADVESLLEQEHYELQALDLLRDRQEGSAPSIPDDASAVFLARPETMLTAPENDALLEYMAKGGRLLVLLDVGSPVPRLVERLGISVPEGIVMDVRRVYPYNDRPLPVYRSHVITRDLLDDELITVLAHVAPLKTAQPAPEGVRYSTLLRTGRRGWIERGGALERGMAVFEAELDAEGPVDMALAVDLTPGRSLVQRGQLPGRVVVVGDADLMTNALISEGPGNATFIVNSARWLVGDDARLSVVGRPTRVRRLALTEEDTAMIRWMAMGLMPLCVFLLGAAVWGYRRGR